MNAFMRRSSVVLFSALLLSALMLSACGFRTLNGSGRIVTESRPVSDVNAITLAGSGELVITQGDTESLTVEADDNLLPYILSSVQAGRLTLGYDRDDWTTFYRSSRPIRFLVTIKDLASLELSGSGSVDVPFLKAERLDLTLSGSGDIAIGHLVATELNYTHSGSGTATLAGRVTRQEATLSGSGQYQAGDLESDTARFRLSGSGSATVWAHDTLDVGIEGSGSVSYYGHPAVTSKSSGSGSILSLGDK